VQTRGTSFPLKIQIKNSPYEQEVKQFDSYITSGALRLSPYRAPLVPSVLGARIDGKIDPSDDTKDGTIILLPLRDKTLILITDSQTYMADFEVAVLANLTFVP
jgi:hypothetical protein